MAPYRRSLTLRAELVEAGLPRAADLRAATPDDLVILSFSGHGHTDANGSFFLLPNDSGTGPFFSTERLSQLISSDELAHWLKDIDAGALTLVIDACHAAASVPSGFRPGPLGDRGLGQLAYDKGMRLLAATQADDVAIESGLLGLGVLTYALTQEAFVTQDGRLAADVDGDGLTLKEWLRFGVDRVPALYVQLLAGDIKLKDAVVNEALIADRVRRAQTPQLFDFSRGHGEVVILF